MVKFSLYQLVWLFFVYAFMGWCAEVAFAGLRHGRFVNRGFLNGPICPIYGFGLVGVIYLLVDLKDSFWILFLGSIVVTTALEYATGWVLEKLFHAKWWDYTNNRFNIRGYVCLEFSLMWGLAATFVVRVIHPMVMTMIDGIPHGAGTVMAYIMLGLTAVDLGATLAAICNMQKKLRLITAAAKEMHEISDIIGENVSRAAVGVRKRTEEAKELYGDLIELSAAHRAEEKALIEKNREEERQLFESIREKERSRRDVKAAIAQADRREKAKELRDSLRKKSFTYRRIARAFPDLGLDDGENENDK